MLGIKTSKTLHQWQAGRYPAPRRETVGRIPGSRTVRALQGKLDDTAI